MSLFDAPRFCPTCGRPISDPDAPAAVPGKQATSRLAALRALPRSGSARHAILDLIFRLGPQTDEEIQDRTLLGGNTERPRRGELVTGGWLRDTGLTRDGKILWGLTDYARRNLPT